MEIGQEIMYKSSSDEICEGIIKKILPPGWNGY